MIFYDCSTAPSPRRARIFLIEKQADYQTVEIDLRNGEQFSEAYRAINPACTVPALQLDDGTVLIENAGIAAYLESEYPDNPLLGTGSEEKGEVAAWVAKIEFEGLMAVAEALRNGSPAMQNRAITGPANFAQIPELAERGRQRFGLFLDRLEAQLTDRDFVCTNRFTNADISACVVVDFARMIKISPSEQHVNILRWRESLNSRASISG